VGLSPTGKAPPYHGARQYMTFTSLNLFASIIAFFASQGRRFNALTIQTGRRWMFVPSRFAANSGAQGIM